MNRLLYITILLLITMNVSGQAHKLSRDEMRMDMDSLISFIEQVHPNPYANVSKKEIFRDIEQSKKMLPDSANLIDFFSITTPIVAKLKDGHTQIKPPLDEYISLNPYCFPFNPKISAVGKLYISENQLGLPQDAELISINSVLCKPIFQKLINSIDGESYNWRIQILMKSFYLRYGAFYGFVPNYTIKYKIGAKTVTSIIAGSKYSDISISASKIQKKDNNKNKPYSFKLISENKTGIIDFNSFTGENGFPTFLDSIFSVIKQNKTENLIIDMRNNGGGNSGLGDELFQYISKVSFSQFGKVITKYSNIRRQYYEKNRKNFAYLASLSDSAFNAAVYKNPCIDITLGTLDTLRENSLRFTGNTYLLTSIRTFSSASDFAWCFKYFNMGKIVGEETGGFIVCFGDIITAPLPISNLELYISHREFYGYGATDKERHGIIPDYKVRENEALDFTLKLIDKKTIHAYPN